ncbi:MAG: hypothetical protein JKY65_25440, partial [Planctomycetes bacterium]|nr:hypothetical protein [Planctomycetota bacterium]
MDAPLHTFARLALALALVLVLVAVGSARADVVHLTNGRRVSGEVVRENEKEVVIKTPQGRVTLPRRLVDRIERQSGDATLLELARERLAAGARKEGEALLRKAARSKDAGVASRAKARLASLEAKDRQRARKKGGPRTSFALPAKLQGKPTEGATLQEQFDRVRFAIDYRDGPRALGLLKSLRAQNPKRPVLEYLAGRAHELAGDSAAAKTAFLSALGSDARRVKGKDLGWIKDLARRAVAGETISRKSTPGAGTNWYRVAGTHAAVYSLHEIDGRLASRFDVLAARARRVFDLRARDSDLDGRILIGLCVDRRELRRLGEAPPLRVVAPDGVLWRLNCLARDLNREAPLLVARALLARAVPGTPEKTR